MGSFVSTLQRKALRKVKRFNIENRTDRLLAKEKRPVAPLPTQTIREIELIKKEFPDAVEAQLKKDSSLDDKLKQVFVTSYDPQVEIKQESSRPLPKMRRLDLTSYGFSYFSPSVMPEGRCSLLEAIQFLTDHRSDPETNTANVIATKFSLEEHTVEKVLENYQIFIVEKLPVQPQATLFGFFDTEPYNPYKDFNPPERKMKPEDRKTIDEFKKKILEDPQFKNFAAENVPTKK